MTGDTSPPRDITTAIHTERFGLARSLAAVLPVCYAVAIHPREFFGAIGTNSGFRNALTFFVLALTLYVVIQILFEQALIVFAGYNGQPVVAYYAAPFAQQGLPLPEVFGLLTAVLYTIATGMLAVAVNAPSIWAFAQSFVHWGAVAPLRTITLACLYAMGAIGLILCFLGLPAAYLDSHVVQATVGREGTSLNALARFVSGTGLYAKSEAVFYYMFLRSISFTTNLRLHWGFIFTILTAYAIVVLTGTF